MTWQAKRFDKITFEHPEEFDFSVAEVRSLLDEDEEDSSC